MNSSCLKILLALLIILPVQAKRFSSQYTEFELPPGWDCVLKGAEWVCQSENKNRQKEAIIILAAKIRGEQDGLEPYLAYLKTTKTFNLPNGNTQVSEAKYAKLVTINNHRWVDALHLASEVPGFYTRYMATVKSDIGVVATFSVSKEHYSSYQPIFENVIKTLRVFRQQAVKSEFKLKKRDEDLFQQRDQDWIDGTGEAPDISQQNAPNQAAGGQGGASSLIWILIIAVAAFVLLKLRKKKK